MAWDIGAIESGTTLSVSSPLEDSSPPDWLTSPPPGESSPPEFPAPAELPAGTAQGRMPLFLLDIELDTGTEYVSSKTVNVGGSPPSKIYEPFVVSWGIFENGIPSPVGLPITGDARFKLAESQSRKWRDLFAHQTPRGRKVKLWALFEGESLTMRVVSPLELRTPFFSGEIVNAAFNSDRSIDITCRDITYAWIDEPIPAMITKDIYPGLMERYEGQFLPIITGEVRTTPQVETSPPDVAMNKRGQIALPRMGWNQETGDRWGVAAHPCARIVVYRKVELAIDGEQTEEWEYVSPGEYAEAIIPVNAFNLSMNHHVIDFFVQQPDGTELRADVDGIHYRGPWGGLEEVGTPLGSPPQTTFGGLVAIRNPIDFFINMTFFLMNKAGVSGGDGSVFDVDDISRIREKFQVLGFACDGAITKPITGREWLEQFLKSFNLDMWQKRNGKISLNYTDEENASRTIYTETDLILKNTFSERTPEKPFTQFQYRYLHNFADETWGAWGLLNTSGQAVMVVDGEPKIEKDIVDLYFVRQFSTAITVTAHRSEFVSPGSYLQEWQLPLPEVPVSLEPSSLIGVTHRMGLEIGGYVNREVKVLKLRHDLDKLVTTVNGILRVPQTVTQGSPA